MQTLCYGEVEAKFGRGICSFLGWPSSPLHPVYYIKREQNIHWFSLYPGFQDYTDAFDRSEIERIRSADSTRPPQLEEREAGEGAGLEAGQEAGPSERPVADNWYLLSLSGNTSLVHSRLPDFLNYLKINLGGLTETDYEAVTVNSVSYVPSLLVNISFTGPHSLAQLAKLAERNDSGILK